MREVWTSARGALVLSLLAACGPAPSAEQDAGRSTHAAYETRELGGAVVATVDGTPIHVDEVRAAVAATGHSPRDVLRRLETERALELRAHEAGFGDDPEVLAETRRASVRALISVEVEQTVTPQAIAQADVDARYETDRLRFARPELRASSHLLVSVARESQDAMPAAERFVRQALVRMQAADDALEEARALATEAQGRVFSVTFEDVPASPQEGSLAQTYADALFALETPGVVPRVVASEYGFHVIVLTGIEAPWEAPRHEAEAVVRRQIAVETRAARLMELEDRLVERSRPLVDEGARARALTMPIEAATPSAP